MISVISSQVSDNLPEQSVFYIIPVYNLSWMTINLLESTTAYSQIKKPVYTIIDNGSEDNETKSVLNYLLDKNLSHILLKNETPLGFPKAVNIGFKMAISYNCKYIFLLNNDTLVSPSWDTNLVRIIKNSKYGALGPITTKQSWRDTFHAQQIIENKFKFSQFKKSYDRHCKVISSSFGKKIIKTNFIPFFCVAFNTKFLDKVGLLDENFKSGLFEDTDYCLRIIKLGGSIAVDYSTYVHHFHHSTFIKHQYNYGKIISENQKYFLSKNHVDPLKFKSISEVV